MFERNRAIMTKTIRMNLCKRGATSVLAVFAILVLLCSGVGCGLGRDTAGHRSLNVRVCLVHPGKMLDEQGAEELELLRGLYPMAAVFTFDEFASAVHACLGERAVMIMVDADQFPMRLWAPLTHFLDSGGKALLLGEKPFEERVRLVGGEPVTVAEVWRQRLAGALAAGRLSSVQLWGARAADDETPGIARVAEHPDLPWSGVDVTVGKLASYNMLVSPEGAEAGAAELPRGVNALGFYARGSESTTRLSLLLRMRNGQVFASSIVLESQWKPYVLPMAFFHPLEQQARHRPDMELNLADVESLAVGLDNRVAPQLPGRHSYGISDVKFLEGIDVAEFLSWPDLPLVSPPFMHYLAQAESFQDMATDQQEDITSQFESPLPARKIPRRNGRPPVRSIPLSVGHDASGNQAGWSATLFVSQTDEQRAAIWGWIGMRTVRNNRKWMQRLIEDCVARIYDGAFFCGPPRQPVLLSANDMIPVEAAWVAPETLAGQVRVVGELLASDGRRLRRVAASLGAGRQDDGLIHTSSINLGRAPGLKNDIQDYALRITLEDIAANGRVYDESLQYLKVFGDKEAAGSWLKCSGSRFLSERQAVYLMGVDYRPLNNLMLPEDQRAAWLEADLFCARQVRHDLELLSQMNVNAVKIRYEHPEQAEALRYFVAEAARRGIRVGIEMPGISPINYDLDQIETMIRDARIAQADNIFALYFAPETILSTAAEREMLNPAWQNWLVNQYGSLARAEKLMGKPAWHQNGSLGGPSNDELAHNGPHSIAVAVYRRFAEDFISRRYGFLVRFIRSLGCRQLISAISAPASLYAAIPFDLTAGGIHLDYLSPSAAGLAGDSRSFNRLAFISAYARGGRGVVKPVVWTDFGVSVGPQPVDPDLQNQERVYDAMFNMINLSSCAGSFGRSYSAARGFQAPDYGLVGPGGIKRPVTMTFTRHARRLRTGMIYPATWRGRIFSKSSDARGLAGLFEEWGDTYADELEKEACVEIRPFGFGTTTEDMPRLTLGGVPFTAPAPLECANAEWGQIWVNGHLLVRQPGEPLAVQWGDKVRIELINTGVATWSPSSKDQEGTAWVQIQSPRGTRQQQPVAVVPPGSSEHIEWNATETGTWTMRPLVFGLGAFGEVLEIRVAGQGNF